MPSPSSTKTLAAAIDQLDKETVTEGLGVSELAELIVFHGAYCPPSFSRIPLNRGRLPSEGDDEHDVQGSHPIRVIRIKHADWIAGGKGEHDAQLPPQLAAREADVCFC